MSCDRNSKYLIAAVTFSISAVATISVYQLRRRWSCLESKVVELQKSLKSAQDKTTAERQGRIRAQQALRKALLQPKDDKLDHTSYPMAPIGVVQSCYSTRNGTPRQPLLVPLARACLVFDPSRVPSASLEGLEEYSHCWIIYVFHLNTDLDKLWKQPSQSKLKAKVRVPKLKGEKKGVFATRSPHRPSPIGLTVAKVEAVKGHMVLLSGVDLVDGTPILDIKPYLPYCESIQGATVPNWVTEDNMLSVASVNFSECFLSTLDDCWVTAEKKSLYASPHELQSLIKQVLSWDIRSVSQRNRPHEHVRTKDDSQASDNASDLENDEDVEVSGNISEAAPIPPEDIIYHLILEGLDVSYRIDSERNVTVENVQVSADIPSSNHKRCNYLMWKDRLG